MTLHFRRADEDSFACGVKRGRCTTTAMDVAKARRPCQRCRRIVMREIHDYFKATAALRDQLDQAGKLPPGFMYRTFTR